MGQAVVVAVLKESSAFFRRPPQLLQPPTHRPGQSHRNAKNKIQVFIML